MFGASSELASVMELGFNCVSERTDRYTDTLIAILTTPGGRGGCELLRSNDTPVTVRPSTHLTLFVEVFAVWTGSVQRVRPPRLGRQDVDAGPAASGQTARP